MSGFSEVLSLRAKGAGVSLTSDMVGKIEKYHSMLTEANAKFNLTRIEGDISEVIDRNYIDSLAPIGKGVFEGAETVVDIGSGAGFPGIPLSIALSDARFTLIDSLGKRVDFLQSVIDETGLNAEAVNARCEEAGRGYMRERFDIAVSRAVAPMNVLIELALPLLKVGGKLIAYKGPMWKSEIDLSENALRALGGIFDGYSDISIPQRDWEHVIVITRKVSATPDKYPRRVGIPEKRPL